MFTNTFVLKTLISDAQTLKLIEATGIRYTSYTLALNSLVATVELVQRVGGVVQEQTFESVVYLYDGKLYQTWVEEA
jgi:hypothetical protein